MQIDFIQANHLSIGKKEAVNKYCMIYVFLIIHFKISSKYKGVSFFYK